MVSGEIIFTTKYTPIEGRLLDLGKDIESMIKKSNQLIAINKKYPNENNDFQARDIGSTLVSLIHNPLRRFFNDLPSLVRSQVIPFVEKLAHSFRNPDEGIDRKLEEELSSFLRNHKKDASKLQEFMANDYKAYAYIGADNYDTNLVKIKKTTLQKVLLDHIETMTGQKRNESNDFNARTRYSPQSNNPLTIAQRDLDAVNTLLTQGLDETDKLVFEKNTVAEAQAVAEKQQSAIKSGLKYFEVIADLCYISKKSEEGSSIAEAVIKRIDDSSLIVTKAFLEALSKQNGFMTSTDLEFGRDLSYNDLNNWLDSLYTVNQDQKSITWMTDHN